MSPMKTSPFPWLPVLSALTALSAGAVRAEGLKLTHELVVPPSVQAAAAQHSVVTLLRAYELALEKDRTYAAAQAAYRAMQEKVPQARAALRPNVALSAGLTDASQQSSHAHKKDTGG